MQGFSKLYYPIEVIPFTLTQALRHNMEIVQPSVLFEGDNFIIQSYGYVPIAILMMCPCEGTNKILLTDIQMWMKQNSECGIKATFSWS